MSYTSSQSHFINHSDGHNLVVALPGSGKSHSAIGACKHILALNPDNTVLMVTFTRAATNEMQHRLYKALGSKDSGRVKVETFHSLFLEQYKQYNQGFQLAIGNVQANFVLRAKNRVNSKMDDNEAKQIVERLGRMFDTSGESAGAIELYKCYVELMTRYNYVDFNIIARRVCIGLDQEQISPMNFTHAIVDEFQDCDDVQYDWLCSLGHNGTKLSCVGDDDQSIYGFRGSSGYKVLVDFQREFQAMGHQLIDCFRCAPVILYVAEKFIRQNIQRIPKTMVSNVKESGEVKIIKCKTAQAQTDAVLNQTLSNTSEWAILARTNQSLDEIEKELSKFGVRANRLGGKSIWDHPTAELLMKFLYSLTNPGDVRFLHEILGLNEECEDVIHDICSQARSSGGFCGVIESPEFPWGSRTHKIQQQFVDWTLDLGNDAVIKTKLTELAVFMAKMDFAVAGVSDSVIQILLGMKGSLFSRTKKITERLFTSNANTAEAGQNTITLATMHGSKGLEWERVWILDVNHGKVPNKRALEEHGVEEERRLFYVAMTRAKVELCISYVYDQSIFITHIEETCENHIKQLVAKEAEPQGDEAA